MPKPSDRLLILLAMALVPAFGRAQSFNGSITGRVTDPSGAVVSGAALVLKNVKTGVEIERTSTDTGGYGFRNLVPATYELGATSTGFRPFVQRDIEVTMNADVRVDVPLAMGTQTERVEVVATSVLNYESGARGDGIAPDTLAQLPLLVSGGARSALNFAILMPGVSTGGQGNAEVARINGGMQAGDETVLDGVSMQQGFMGDSGMLAIYDFPFSPDMVSEIKLLTSSYEPQYGSSTSGQILSTTRSGGEQFHGSVFEYHRNTRLNARQFGADERPNNIQHNFGANLGGPAKIRGLWSSKVKTYFYVNFEGYRIDGGVNRPTLSIPSAAERQGDFSDWRDASGNLIPIYDPATTRVLPDGTVVRDPFPGNIIPASRISPLARQWLQYLPDPTSGGPLNNYLAPNAPAAFLAQNYFMGRFDTYIGQKDHLAISIGHQRVPANLETILPHEIAQELIVDPQNSSVSRLNWDHTFGPNLLHHFSFGYLNRNEGLGCVNQDAADKLPQIAGVVSHKVPPMVDFSDGFAWLGCFRGLNRDNITTRPTYVANDLLTWVKGSHTVKAGLEYRNVGGNIHKTNNEQGYFFFGRGATGLLGVNSGNPIASFLLGAVDNADVDFRTVSAWYPRQAAYIAHIGDTWTPSRRLTLNYGLRWDLFTPVREKFNRLSFFDPSGANPGAGGRPGRLAFAGTEYGAASFGKDYPEKLYWKAFAPRLGVTFAVAAHSVVRAGWGIFYDRAFYPGWGGGMSLDGFSSNVAFNSRLGGLEPAFYLEQGFPQDFPRPPFIRSDFRNGQAILYRPLDGNERPRSHQWNLTLDREIGRDFLVSVAYVGSKGEQLPSIIDPLNALDPALLTTYGARLYDEFQPGQTVLHGVGEPYPGWRDQMVSCAPSLAQALLPYPQYCDRIQGVNEAHGDSIYHSLQLKAEKRLSRGIYALVSYTFSKLITSGSDNIQSGALTFSGSTGVISPYERERNRALAVDDVPHLVSAALVYELPFGRGKKFAKQGRVSNAVLGGWQLSTIFRYSSGIPFFFRSSYCNVPSQFRVACIPALKEGANPWAQDKSRFDPSKGPLFDKNAFEPVDAFNFYYGRGPRVSSLRGFAYRNQDLTLVKTTSLGRRLRLQLRIEAFNLWNWHVFNHRGDLGAQAFDTDLASPDFGKWNGAVSNPRNVQVAARLEF